MKRALDTLLPVGGVCAALASFHFWGEAQRYREWWWIGGDETGLIYLDLSDVADQQGHILFVDQVAGGPNLGQVEYDVSWLCSSQSIEWGESWSLERDMTQIERTPSSDEMHLANTELERSALRVACGDRTDPNALQTFEAARAPYEITRDALAQVAQGVDPFSALMAAAAKTDVSD